MPHRKLAKVVARLDEPPIVNRVGFELLILAMSFIAGVGIWTFGPPASIEKYMLPVVTFAWIVGLIVYPVAIAYALLMKDRVAGLHLECYLLAPFGLLWLVYPVVVIANTGEQSIIASALALTCTVSCMSTSYLIRRKLRRLGLWKLKIG